MRVAVYCVNAGSSFGNKRARYVADSMRQGLIKHGISAPAFAKFSGVVADVAVAYGWVHEPIFSAYKAAGARFVYWDLGYWNRRPKNAARDGHHRLAVDDWDTASSMLRGCPGDRLEALGVPFVERREKLGDEILVAGMSEKAAGTHGFKAGEWERRMAGVLRRMAGPDVPIVVRPKPSKRQKVETTIEQALERARLLVTHHSNAAIDALALDVPIYCVKGAGALLSPPALSFVDPARPPSTSAEERLALLRDVAYAQWSVPEMQSGAAWEHVKRIICA